MSTGTPVTVEQTLNVSHDVVWGALTDPSKMREWFFENIEEFEAKEGFEVQFDVMTGERNFVHKWKVKEAKPRQRLMLDWQYEGYAGQSLVTFNLSKAGNQTKLVLTHEGLESFPQDVPEFTRESCQEGWDYFIKKQLTDYLADNP